ncbi:MAG: hypothetical protein O2963_00025 [Proteobacteria bacterium]|nr:hypothetical protein [Pseudomonadota bacterium]
MLKGFYTRLVRTKSRKRSSDVYGDKHGVLRDRLGRPQYYDHGRYEYRLDIRAMIAEMDAGVRYSFPARAFSGVAFGRYWLSRYFSANAAKK